ncbi:hypothetical protein CA11_56900 [Gimesia maris]|nr:hypothetical protein CA11_56900 [Gimesia maris]
MNRPENQLLFSRSQNAGTTIFVIDDLCFSNNTVAQTSHFDMCAARTTAAPPLARSGSHAAVNILP